MFDWIFGVAGTPQGAKEIQPFGRVQSTHDALGAEMPRLANRQPIGIGTGTASHGP